MALSSLSLARWSHSLGRPRVAITRRPSQLKTRRSSRRTATGPATGRGVEQLRRLGFNVAHSWLDDVLRGAALVNPTVDDYMAAAARVPQYPDQPLTLFDTVLASVSARLAWPVWTYDHHFDLLRTAVWR